MKSVNKGLAFHIIVTIIYFIGVQYVNDGYQTTRTERLNIAFTCFFVNFVLAIFCLLNNWYDDTSDNK